MRWLLGSWLLLAGCAVSPDRASDRAERAEPHGLPAPPPGDNVARVGIEYLPALDAPRTAGCFAPGCSRASGLQVRPLPLPRPGGPLILGGPPCEEPRDDHIVLFDQRGDGAPRAAREPKPAREEPWTLSEAQLARISDPTERFTLQFVSNVLGEDRRRVQRQVGAPAMFTNLRSRWSFQGIENDLDERDFEDRAILFARDGRKLLSHPFRKALRQSTALREIEAMLDEFKAENIPLSGAYQRSHGRRSSWGRVSMRLRPSDGSDPAEIVYIRSGWKFGTSQEKLRVHYAIDLAEDVGLSMRSRYDYVRSELILRGDVHYRFDRDTRAHVMVGNRIDLLTGSRMYPVVMSPLVTRAEADSLGLMFYVEHLF